MIIEVFHFSYSLIYRNWIKLHILSKYVIKLFIIINLLKPTGYVMHQQV